MCVCVFLYPEINNKQNSNTFKLNQQKICVYVCCVCENNKTAHFTQSSKTNVMYFFILFASFCNAFLINATHNYYLHPSAKECLLKCWIETVCVCEWVSVDVLVNFSSNKTRGTQQRKLIISGRIFTQWGFCTEPHPRTRRELMCGCAVVFEGHISIRSSR